MAQEILSVKLQELDQTFGQLHRRVRQLETLDREGLRFEAEEMKRECDESRLALQNRLRNSRAGTVARLAKTYDELQEVIHRSRSGLSLCAPHTGDESADAEEAIVAAEYALDFAIQSANYALLLAVRANAAQKALQEAENDA